MKLSINQIYEQAIDDGFVFWEIQNKHIAIYHKVPLFEKHRDPFDRLLIATAYEEKVDVITIDHNFLLYPNLIKVLW